MDYSVYCYYYNCFHLHAPGFLFHLLPSDDVVVVVAAAVAAVNSEASLLPHSLGMLRRKIAADYLLEYLSCFLHMEVILQDHPRLLTYLFDT